MDEEGRVLNSDMLNGKIIIETDQGLKLTFPNCRIRTISHNWFPYLGSWIPDHEVSVLRSILRLEFDVIDQLPEVEKMGFWDILKLLFKRPPKDNPFNLILTSKSEE